MLLQLYATLASAPTRTLTPLLLLVLLYSCSYITIDSSLTASLLYSCSYSNIDSSFNAASTLLPLPFILTVNVSATSLIWLHVVFYCNLCTDCEAWHQVVSRARSANSDRCCPGDVCHSSCIRPSQNRRQSKCIWASDSIWFLKEFLPSFYSCRGTTLLMLNYQMPPSFTDCSISFLSLSFC